MEVESCTPLVGCVTETTVDQDATRELRESKPLGRFVGLDIYLDRGHLAFAEISEAWSKSATWDGFWDKIFNLPLYRALAFTLTYTFVATPSLIVLGLIIALAVNSLHRHLKGLMIFFSLLPMIVTPVIGSLSLFWMVDSRGVVGSALVAIAGDPNFSRKGCMLRPKPPAWPTTFATKKSPIQITRIPHPLLQKKLQLFWPARSIRTVQGIGKNRQVPDRIRTLFISRSLTSIGWPCP